LKSIIINVNEKFNLPLNLFKGIINLESIRISGNGSGGVKMIPTTSFKGLLKLKTINLDGNQFNFTNFHPRAFAGLNSLQILIISNNVNQVNIEQNVVRKYCGCSVIITY
jgi:hypothetical protein